jgi:hypothetical protein
MSFVKDDDAYYTVKSFFLCTELRSMTSKNSKFGVGAVSSETYNLKLNSYQSLTCEKKETYVLAGINVTFPVQDLPTHMPKM